MTIATGTCKMKDEAVEYLASGELRLDSSFGYLNFDDVCYLTAIRTDEFGVAQPLDLDEVLYNWEDMEVSDNHATRADHRPPPERLGLPHLMGLFGQSKEISALAAVANRYRGGGTVVFTPTNLPQNRSKIFALLAQVFHLTEVSEYTAAASVLSYVLKLDPDNLDALQGVQCTFLNTDDSISYFAKNLVLELSKKCRWSAVILTILKFNERVPYHERVQVSDFVIFGQLEFLKICAAFLNFAQTRFL